MSFQSRAVGVAHSFVAMESGIPAPLPLIPFALSRSRRASHVAGPSPSFGFDAAGVGQRAPGDDEEAGSSVRGADIGCTDGTRDNAIAEVAQTFANNGKPSTPEGRDVFDDDGARAQLFDDAAVLVPEPRTRTLEARPLASERYILTREPAAHHVDRLEILPSNLTDVLMAYRLRPVTREHASAPCVLFDLPNDPPEPGALEPQFKTADAGEERTNLHRSRRQCPRTVAGHSQVNASGPGWLRRVPQLRRRTCCA